MELTCLKSMLDIEGKPVLQQPGDFLSIVTVPVTYGKEMAVT